MTGVYIALAVLLLAVGGVVYWAATRQPTTPPQTQTPPTVQEPEPPADPKADLPKPPQNPELTAYIEKRDALDAEAQLKLIEQTLVKWNNGAAVKIYSSSIESGVIRKIDLRASRYSSGEYWGNAQLVDLTPLTGLKLYELNLGWCASITTLAGIEGMPLKELLINNCTNLQDISALKGMPLESLNIEESTALKDIRPVGGLPLKRLSLRGCTSLDDISALKGMPLEALTLGGGAIADLEPMRGMPLTEVSIDSCDQLTSIAPLQGKQLILLRIIGCENLKDFSVLEKIDIKQLLLEGTQVSDLSPLQGKEFRELAIRKSDQLKSLNGIENVTTKRFILLQMNGLIDLAALKQIDAELITLGVITDAPIKDLTVFEGSTVKRLRLSSCRAIESVKGIESLPNLIQLGLPSRSPITEDQYKRIKKDHPNINIGR